MSCVGQLWCCDEDGDDDDDDDCDDGAENDDDDGGDDDGDCDDDDGDCDGVDVEYVDVAAQAFHSSLVSEPTLSSELDPVHSDPSGIGSIHHSHHFAPVGRTNNVWCKVCAAYWTGRLRLSDHKMLRSCSQDMVGGQ